MAAIGDYAIIGDGRSAALVDRHGAIDWLCWPRFESSPIFGALLDERGGTWRIAPTETYTTTRGYQPHTNILDTTFSTHTGRAVVTDLMTIVSEEDKRELMMPEHELVRCVRCDHGEIVLDVEVSPRPDFARGRTRDLGALGLRWEDDASLLTLRGEVPLVLDDAGRAHARFHLHAGEHAIFSLTYEAEAPAILPLLGVASLDAIEHSARWWREWADRATYRGPYRELVVRSALALKLLSFAPAGAASTTSLPVHAPSFTVRALLSLGYVEDGQAFCRSLLHAPRLACHELLLDTYGELIDATAQLARATGHLDDATQALLRGYGRHVCDHWREPDIGITEHRHRTHARVCCWVAVDRLIELCKRGLLDRLDTDRLIHERTAIRTDIERHAYDEAHQTYASSLGGTEVDAALLQMSWSGFHPANSPRMVSTFARIREQLSVAPGLFHRDLHSVRRDEGAFWLCSFWAVEHLANAGALDDARRLFDHACAYANDLGLMAEEVDPHTGTQLGNFPQASTHVGAISAALALDEHHR